MSGSGGLISRYLPTWLPGGIDTSTPDLKDSDERVHEAFASWYSSAILPSNGGTGGARCVYDLAMNNSSVVSVSNRLRDSEGSNTGSSGPRRQYAHEVLVPESQRSRIMWS